MPIKYNLTKFDVLANKVKKITQSRNHEITDEDRATIIKAIIIASFASGHSWKTHKTITTTKQLSNYIEEIAEEYREAKENKWRLITPFDIAEVAEKNIDNSLFSQWLYFCVDKNERERYLNAWQGLQKEFNEACDNVPKKEF